MQPKSTRRQPRRPSVPRQGGASQPTRRPSVPPPTAAVATGPADMPVAYGHVGRDLRRIALFGALMFALIFGARWMADAYGTSFVLDFIR